MLQLLKQSSKAKRELTSTCPDNKVEQFLDADSEPDLLLDLGQDD